eukprot:Gb_28034 [translate_table: standard]
MVRKRKCRATVMCLEAKRPKTKEESQGQRPPPLSDTIRSPNTSRRMSSGEEVVVEDCCCMDLGSMWITDDCCLSLGGSLVSKEDEDVSLLPSKAKIPPKGTKKMVMHPRAEVVKWLVQWEGMQGNLVTCQVILEARQGL